MEGILDRSFSPEISYKYVGISSVVAELLCLTHVCFPCLCLYVGKKMGTVPCARVAVWLLGRTLCREKKKITIYQC